MQSDPVIEAFHVGPWIYDISGRLSPASIRDQMVRARLLVDRAVECNVFRGGLEVGPQSLLVVGAGAAGVTAAMRAASRGVDTWLIDKASEPFALQHACETRWIHPNLYDWPGHPWGLHKAEYPYCQPAMPLTWEEGLASDIATCWRKQFEEFEQTGSQLRFLRGVGDWEIDREDGERGWTVSAPNRQPWRVAAVILAVGQGDERSSLGDYSGYAFWQSDKLDDVQAGVRVFVSGGGDGAQQDFLRIATGVPRIAELIDRLGGLHSARRRLLPHEEAARRTLNWAADARHDHPLLERLEQQHRAAAADALADRSVVRGLQSLFDRPLPRLTLVHPCTHLSHCYPLNRFLVRLVATYLKENPLAKHGVEEDHKWILPKHACTRVLCDHDGPRGPDECFNERHLVGLSRAARCGVRVRTPTDTPEEEHQANVVVIRHGVDSSGLWSPGDEDTTSVRLERQLLPYHAPSTEERT